MPYLGAKGYPLGTKGGMCPLTALTRWDEKAGLPRDAIRSQLNQECGWKMATQAARLERKESTGRKREKLKPT